MSGAPRTEASIRPASAPAGASPDVPRARRRRAALALFVVAVIWGITFLWMKQAVSAGERVLGPGHAMVATVLWLTIRFALAALLMYALFPTARRPTRGAWTGGAWLGLLLILGFVLQMVGLVEISPAVCAFLTSLYVLFLALTTAVLERRPPRAAIGIGALLATAGAGLVRGRPEITVWRWGEVLTVIAAFAFALHILVTDRVTRREPPIAVTFTMFAWVALGSAAILLFQVARGAAPEPALLVELALDHEFFVSMLLMTVFATVLALTLMNLYQRDLDPVRAAILYALEPVWATLFGIAAGTDAFTSWLVLGGGLLVVGNLCAEWPALRLLAGKSETVA